MITILKHFAAPDPVSSLIGKQARLVRRVCTDEATLIAAVEEGCDILLADGSVPLQASFFEATSQLQRVIYFDIGLIHRVDLSAATRQGVTVTLPVTRSQNAVAEHTIAMLFALRRCLIPALAEGQTGGWAQGSYEHLRGGELSGSTLGIVGWSRIGRLVAGKASALGIHVLVHSSQADPKDIPYPLLGLTELLKKADVISLHTRLTPANHGLIGEQELRSMKPTAYLINTARGALIDETALERALREGWIAGAALDVLATEPPPKDHPLLQLPNVLVTPHIAWNTNEVYALAVKDLQEELRRAVAGEPPLNCANPEVLCS